MAISISGDTGLNSPTISNVSAVLTLPATTDVLVGRATADTLSNKTFSNATLFAAGTALLPAITITGDLNTGLWFPAADTIAISTAGVERLRVDASGNLGLGNTPSGTYKLEVTGKLAVTNQITSSLAIGTAPFVVTSTTPVANLSIGGNAATATNLAGAVTLPSGVTLVAPVLGTPASGTVTNLTGTASININGTVGATTAAAGTFTSIFAPLLKNLFYKADSSTVAFTKTGAGTLSIKAGTIVAVQNATLTFATATAITMCALSAGTDYAIYVCDDGSIRTDASFSYPVNYTAANSRKIGGFHYAPGGNAPAQSGGDTTPVINEYSLWDIKFKPIAPDPRGKMMVLNGFWSDIYFLGVDAITNGSSKYGVAYADGASPPKIPTCFGGNGSAVYSTFDWFVANEMASYFGMRLSTQQEFMALAYGTTEASSEGTERHNTGLYAAYTSRWGAMQATGCLWVWGAMRAGAYATAGWNPVSGTTASRGSEYNAPNALLLGGDWGIASFCGSRCSAWGNAALSSGGSVGVRCCCDHLQLD